MSEKVSKGNAVFDYTKFVLSLMIVAFHTRFLANILSPWLRMAVPIFFVILSYFFFSKLNRIDVTEQKSALIGFTKRKLQLYIFWTIVLLPVFVYIHRVNLMTKSVIFNVLDYIRRFFFAGTFSASWFIIASVLGTIIVFYLSKKMSNVWLLAFSFVIYIIVCLFSAYRFVIAPGTAIDSAMNFYSNVINLPSNSFPVAVFWITVGKCFADGTFDNIINKKNSIIFIIIGAVLFFFDGQIVRMLSGETNKDCYITLAILVPAIFALIKSYHFNMNKIAIFMRNYSIITYVMHASLLHILRKIYRALGIEYNGLIFITILIITFVATVTIIKLKDKKAFKILKYAC